VSQTYQKLPCHFVTFHLPPLVPLLPAEMDLQVGRVVMEKKFVRIVVQKKLS
jgi:hypothetical protein